MSVITWTVAGGSVVFLLGLVSAIGSRLKSKKYVPARRPAAMREYHSNSTPLDAELVDAMSMAAKGDRNLNREIEGAELATASGHKR